MRAAERNWIGIAAVLAVGVVMGVMPMVAADKIGDPIKFSDQSGKILAPASGIKDDQVSKQFDFLNRKSSMGAVLEPLNVPPSYQSIPNSRRTKRQLELYDQEKNWIYGDAKDINRTPTPEEMFNVQEYDGDGLPQKPKRALERFVEKMSSRSESATNRYESLSSNDKSPNSDYNSPGVPQHFRFSESDDPTGLSAKSNSELTDQRMGVSLDDQFKSPDTGLFKTLVGSTLFNESFKSLNDPDVLREKDQHKTRMDDFHKLLEPSGTANPFAGLGDPINFKEDATRQPINPISPGLDFSARSSIAADTIEASRASLRVPSGAGFSGFGDFGGGAPGGGSLLRSSLPAPSEPSVSLPHPGSLPFPQRKF